MSLNTKLFTIIAIALIAIPAVYFGSTYIENKDNVEYTISTLNKFSHLSKIFQDKNVNEGDINELFDLIIRFSSTETVRVRIDDKSMREFLGNSAEAFTYEAKKVENFLDRYQSNVPRLNEYQYQSEIRETERQLRESEEYLVKSFLPIRRFDTTMEGQGMYEASDYGTRAVVLIADPSQVNIARNLNVPVEDLGERPVTVEDTNAFQTRQTTEYFRHYRTSTNHITPQKAIEKLEELKSEFENEKERVNEIREIEIMNLIENISPILKQMDLLI